MRLASYRKPSIVNENHIPSCGCPAFGVDKLSILGYTAPAVKKRLRKKYHVGEFREIGFYFEVSVCGGDYLSTAGVKFLHALDEECIRPNELDCTLVRGNEGDFFVAYDAHTAKTTETQLQAVRHWLSSRTDVEKFTVSELRDLWHDSIG